MRLEKRVDEVAYLFMIAKEQIQTLGSGTVVSICSQLVAHLSKMLDLNRASFLGKEDWYYQYAYVLISELTDFRAVLQHLDDSSPLKQLFAKSKELHALYACLLGTIRFLEGISWGYSVFLMHQQLDEDSSLAMKVIFN